MDSRTPVLTAAKLSKTFGSTRALIDADIEVHEGEMHALVGANGSGKSTLVKILSGYHEPEEGGRLIVGGQEVSLPMHPSDFTRYGIACVHQDLGLIHGLSVAENLVMYEIAGARRFMAPKTMEQTAQAFLDLVGVRLPLRVPVERLSRSDRALVALARALGTLEAFSKQQGRRGVLVLDEITAFLPRHEVQAMHTAIKRVRDLGHAVVFVSHDLDEVLDSADTVTVLRNGRVVRTGPAAELSHDMLVSLIVGRGELQASKAVRSDTDAHSREVAVQVQRLSGGGIQDASFAVFRGELLGVTGLIGSGFDDIPYLLFGARPATAGRLILDGEDQENVSNLNPRRAIERDIGLIPGDRNGQGLFMELELAENIGSLFLGKLRRLGRLLSWRKMRRLGREAISQYDIVTSSERAFPRELSGGNQQKVLLARWLAQGRRFLLLHEPVQGVDVGARGAIVALLRQRAAEGLPILCASSDYQLLVDLCDRVLVVRNGKITSEVSADSKTGTLDKDRLAELSISGVGEPGRS